MLPALWLLFVSIVFGFVVLLAASSVRFSRFSLSEDENLLLGIPLIVVLFSCLGSWLTVGYKGNISLAFPPLLFFIAWYGNLKLKRPRVSWYEALFLVLLPVLIFAIKIALLYDFNAGFWHITHADNYLYTHLINALQAEKVESGSLQLLQKSFGLPFSYSFYHYLEFYIILLLKKVLDLPSYFYVNLFLQSFFSTFGIYVGYLFFKIRYQHRFSPSLILLLVATLFTSLRFTFLDDGIHAYFMSKGFDLLVLQNFYAPHPLSYFRGYKIAIACLFAIPALHFAGHSSWKLPAGIIGLSTLASVALFPFTSMLAAFNHPVFLFLKGKLKYFTWLLPVFLASLLAWFAEPWGFSGLSTKMLNTYILYTFNQIVENHYFLLALFAVLLLVSSRNGKALAFAILLLVLPLIYFQHQWLFKLYFPLFLGFLAWLLIPIKTKSGLPEMAVALLVMLIITAAYRYISNINQIYTNLLFVLVLVVSLTLLFEYALPTRKIGLALAGLVGLALNFHSAYEHNKMPLLKEQLPQSLATEISSLSTRANLLSIAEFKEFPFLLNSQLGCSFTHYTDQLQWVQGGYEHLTDEQKTILKSTGFDFPYELSPLKDKKFDNLEAEKAFLLQHFKYMLVENLDKFKPYHDFGRAHAKQTYFIRDGNYFCYAF